MSEARIRSVTCYVTCYAHVKSGRLLQVIFIKEPFLLFSFPPNVTGPRKNEQPLAIISPHCWANDLCKVYPHRSCPLRAPKEIGQVYLPLPQTLKIENSKGNFKLGGIYD